MNDLSWISECMTDCIFCKIIKGEIPCAKVFEDDKVICFLDIYPMVKGDVLVVPKNHHGSIYDTPEKIHSHMHLIAQTIAKKQKEVLNCDGANIFQNVNTCGGQEIAHAHIHVTPRYNNDNKIFKFNTHDNYVEGELNKFADKLKFN